MHTKLAARVSRIVAAVLLAAAAGTGLHACSNSLLRNFSEAGAETVLDDPLPTPTRAAH